MESRAVAARRRASGIGVCRTTGIVTTPRCGVVSTPGVVTDCRPGVMRPARKVSAGGGVVLITVADVRPAGEAAARYGFMSTLL